MDISEKELELLRTYEALRVTKEEARELVIAEIKKEVPDLGMSEFRKYMTEEAANIVIENMLDGAVKRLQLVAAFGVEAYITAGETVSEMEEVDIFNAIDLVEKELLKNYESGN